MTYFCYMSIRSRDSRDKSLKLSEITLSSAPANFNGTGLQKFVQNFHPCLVAHRIDKFGEVIQAGPKVIPPNTLNCAPFLNFCILQFFSGESKFLDLTFEATPISHLLAQFYGDRSREPGDFGPKYKSLPSIFWGGSHDSHQYWDIHCLNAHISNHVSRRSADGAPRHSAAKCQNTTKKHQQ